MNLRFILALAAIGLLSAGTPLWAANAGENPYLPIVTRNMFGLVPIPTNPPPVDPASLVPPPKITPNGIMTLFGKLQVLFKVAATPKPGQPAKDESYVMCAGDRENDIEVQKIDEPSATITFNNHGVIQELALVPATASGGGGSAAPAMPAFAAPAPRVIPTAAGRFGRPRNNINTSANNPSPQSPASSGGGGVPSFSSSATTQEQLSPEAQVIMMEAQRAKFLDEGNPAAAIIPPTALTQQVTGERGGGPGAPGGPPAP